MLIITNINSERLLSRDTTVLWVLITSYKNVEVVWYVAYWTLSRFIADYQFPTPVVQLQGHDSAVGEKGTRTTGIKPVVGAKQVGKRQVKYDTISVSDTIASGLSYTDNSG